MLAAIWLVPVADWLMLWLISLVVAVCSSTAAAIVTCSWLICSMTAETSPIAWTAPAVPAWIACTR